MSLEEDAGTAAEKVSRTYFLSICPDLGYL